MSSVPSPSVSDACRTSRGRTIESAGGLTQAEADARLAPEGYNELPAAKPRGLLVIVLEVIREPMFLLLVAASTIYLVFGDVREAIVLLASIVVVMGITIYQSRKTESALEALRDLSSPRALVLRDGMPKRIAGREVVRGDVLMLKEGDRVPADARLFVANDLRADESLLTGESVPVDKTAVTGDMPAARPGGDGLPFVYAGTMLVQGQGSAIVVAVGAPNGVRPHRQGFAIDRFDSDAAAARDRSGGAPAGGGRPAVVRAGRIDLWTDARRLAGRLSGRRDSSPWLSCRGISGRAHGISGAGRVAHIASRRADAPHARNRDAGFGDRAVRRQDGHPDAQPDDGETGSWRAASRYDIDPAMRRCRTAGMRNLSIRHAGERSTPVDPMEKAIVEIGERLSCRKNEVPVALRCSSKSIR